MLDLTGHTHTHNVGMYTAARKALKIRRVESCVERACWDPANQKKQKKKKEKKKRKEKEKKTATLTRKMLFLHVLLPTCHRAIKDGQRQRWTRGVRGGEYRTRLWAAGG